MTDDDNGSDNSVIDQAHKDYQRAKSYWGEIYDKARGDIFFMSDDPNAQWDAKDYKARLDAGRPALTIDQLEQFINQVTNDIRMNTPSINIIPSGSGASMETANVFKGLIRNIEYESGADEAYDTGAYGAVSSSIGFIRVDHEYADDETDEQRLTIKRVINPLAIMIDPDSIECDGRDAKYGFVLDPWLVKDFKAQWPGKEICCFDQPDRAKWDDNDHITIAERFVIQETKLKGPTAREIVKRKVLRYRLSGKEVLEESTFPGRYIPLVPVYGKELWVDGKRQLMSLIRKSKDAQRMFNVWKSLETEVMMKQPQAPVQAPAEAVEDFTDDWLDPQKSMVLRYKQYDAKGNALNKPERLQPAGIPAGFVNASRETVDDIKATMGIYNESLGQKSNAQSGVAINQRKQEGDVATFHFSDNLVRSITQVGRICVFAAPEIYDTERIIRIVNEEEKPDEVGINGARVEGQKETFDLKQGRYDVRVITGASYTTRRQETQASLAQLFQGQPELMQAFGDIYFENSDFSGAQALAARARKLLPANLQDDQDGQDPQVVALQQQLQEAQGIIQQGAQQLQQAQQAAQDKSADTQLKIVDAQTKQADASRKHEVDVLDLQMRMKQMDQDAEFRAAEIALKNRQLDIQEYQLGMTVTQQQTDNEQEVITKAMDQDHELNVQAADQAHDMNMADINAAHTQDQAAQQAELNPPPEDTPDSSVGV